jgi:hypothetical protein
MNVAPSTGVWSIYQWPHAWRKLTLLPQQISDFSSSCGAQWAPPHLCWNSDLLDLLYLPSPRSGSHRCCCSWVEQSCHIQKTFFHSSSSQPLGLTVTPLWCYFTPRVGGCSCVYFVPIGGTTIWTNQYPPEFSGTKPPQITFKRQVRALYHSLFHCQKKKKIHKGNKTKIKSWVCSREVGRIWKI